MLSPSSKSWLQQLIAFYLNKFKEFTYKKISRNSYELRLIFL